MSRLAASLAEVKVSKPDITPRASCFPLYGECDSDDMTAVQRLREAQVPWSEVQRVVDELLEIEESAKINNRRFTRHWKSECSCPVAAVEGDK